MATIEEAKAQLAAMAEQAGAQAGQTVVAAAAGDEYEFTV